jgi:hypothetical protein
MVIGVAARIGAVVFEYNLIFLAQNTIGARKLHL